MRKLYYYLFYKLYRFSISISDDALNDYKPVIFITILEVLFINQFFVWHLVVTKEDIDFSNSKIVFVLIVLLLSSFNYYYFLDKNKWKSYITEFKDYDSKNKYKGSVAVFLVVFFILGGLISSFYCMSQIDWSQYR